jgi:hypothetical protein
MIASWMIQEEVAIGEIGEISKGIEIKLCIISESSVDIELSIGYDKT